MTFFDWFMATIGIICDSVIIFWIVCKVKPSLLENEKIKEIYDEIIGYQPEDEDLYETE